MPYSEITPYAYLERSLKNDVSTHEYLTHLIHVLEPFPFTEDFLALFAGRNCVTPSHYYVKWDNGAVSVEEKATLEEFHPQKYEKFIRLTQNRIIREIYRPKLMQELKDWKAHKESSQ